jgi:hypothetical protein
MLLPIFAVTTVVLLIALLFASISFVGGCIFTMQPRCMMIVSLILGSEPLGHDACPVAWQALSDRCRAQAGDGIAAEPGGRVQRDLVVEGEADSG